MSSESNGQDKEKAEKVTKKEIDLPN